MNDMSDKPYEWQQPKAHSLWASKTLLKGWKGKFFRTLIIVATIELFLYFLLKPLPFKDIGFDIEKVFLILFLFALGMSTFIYLIAPYLIRFDRTNYKIDDKGGVSIKRRGKWKKVNIHERINSFDRKLMIIMLILSPLQEIAKN